LTYCKQGQFYHTILQQNLTLSCVLLFLEDEDGANLREQEEFAGN